MPKDYFKNHEVFWKAAQKFKDLHDAAFAKKDELGIHIRFDDRNLLPLACLMIDTSGIPEDEQVKYFVAEYEKIHKIFDTPGPNDPQRPDPEKIKPYIRQVFDKIVTDIDSVDYNSEKDLLNLFKTMYGTQMIATLIKDFPKEAMEVFPTPEERKWADRISSKAFAIQLDARVKMSHEGLDDIGLYHAQFGKERVIDPGQTLQARIFHTVADSMIKNDDVILFNPAEDDLSTKFFMGETFTAPWDIGAGEMEFTERDYGQFFASHIADSRMNSVFEYAIYSEAKNPTFGTNDILMINGKPFGKLAEELAAKYKLNYDDRYREAGKILREALLKGEPVTLISTSFDLNGKIKFENKDICLDLDKLDLKKLNDLDRRNYSWIRRALDTIGIWTIPKKFLSNKERDAKIAKIKENPNSSHSKAVKAQEENIINSYNSKDHIKGVPQALGDISRDEASKENDLSKTNINELSNQNLSREVLPNIAKDTSISADNVKFSEPVDSSISKSKENSIGNV